MTYTYKLSDNVLNVIRTAISVIDVTPLVLNLNEEDKRVWSELTRVEQEQKSRQERWRQMSLFK